MIIKGNFCQFEMWVGKSIGMILSRQRATGTDQLDCADLHLLFPYGISRFSHDGAHIIYIINILSLFHLGGAG